MKKLSYVLIATIVVYLTSCNGIDPETANAFKGEYWMETTSYIVNGENVEKMGSVWSPVSIYEKDGALFVQTEVLGTPDTISEHPQEIKLYENRPDFSPRRVMEVENVDSGLQTFVDSEPITTTTTHVMLKNTLLLSYYKGIFAQSLPIKVKSGSKTVLNLEKFKPIEIDLIDNKGNYFQTVNGWYEYGPMVKNGDIITWEVQLKYETKEDHNYSLVSSFEIEKIIYKNTLYKR